MRYIALVDGKAGAYGVVVPDLPGCTSAGSTTDEALRNAIEAVRLWVEDAIDTGEALPRSSAPTGSPASTAGLTSSPEPSCSATTASRRAGSSLERSRGQGTEISYGE